MVESICPALGDFPSDDAFDDTCFAWAAARPAPTHLETTHPATGLTDDGARALTAFAASLVS